MSIFGDLPRESGSKGFVRLVNVELRTWRVLVVVTLVLSPLIGASPVVCLACATLAVAVPLALVRAALDARLRSDSTATG